MALWMKDAGIWKEEKMLWVRDAGVWKEVSGGGSDTQIVYNISSHASFTLSDVIAGDLVIVFAGRFGTTNTMPGVLSGFTVLTDIHAGSGSSHANCRAYWRISDGSPHSINTSNTDSWAVYVIRGLASIGSVNTSTTTSAELSFAKPLDLSEKSIILGGGFEFRLRGIFVFLRKHQPTLCNC